MKDTAASKLQLVEGECWAVEGQRKQSPSGNRALCWPSEEVFPPLLCGQTCPWAPGVAVVVRWSDWLLYRLPHHNASPLMRHSQCCSKKLHRRVTNPLYSQQHSRQSLRSTRGIFSKDFLLRHHAMFVERLTPLKTFRQHFALLSSTIWWVWFSQKWDGHASLTTVRSVLEKRRRCRTRWPTDNFILPPRAWRMAHDWFLWSESHLSQRLTTSLQALLLSPLLHCL